MKKILTYFLTFRLHRIPVLLGTLLLGVFASSHHPVLTDYLVLTLVAISMHIFGFGMNDLFDYRVDRNNPKHLNRISLVSRGYHRGRYLIFILAQLPIIAAAGIFTYGFRQYILFAAMAGIGLTLYNAWGKRSQRYILLIHPLFSISMALICMAGFTLYDSISDAGLPVVLLFVSVFFNLLLVNSFSGSLMDFKSDLEAGANSFASALKCSITGGKVTISRLIRLSYRSIFATCIILLSLQALLNKVPPVAWLMMLVLFFLGYVHLTLYLKLDDPVALQKFDFGLSSVMLFYATGLAWINTVPDIWYVIVAIRIIRILTIKEAGRFSLRTVSGFMANLGKPGPL